MIVGYGPETVKSTALNQLRHKIEPSASCEFKYNPEKNVNKKTIIKLTLPNKFDESFN